jgi:hypothetical protein
MIVLPTPPLLNKSPHDILIALAGRGDPAILMGARPSRLAEQRHIKPRSRSDSRDDEA